jgi:predicted ArsR family transcriptional regulator
MRLQTRPRAALATLGRCPSVPADVLACLLSMAAAYQLLARLARAGLAEARPVELGHVLGGRPIGLWSLTERGRRQLGDHADARARPAAR